MFDDSRTQPSEPEMPAMDAALVLVGGLVMLLEAQSGRKGPSFRQLAELLERLERAGPMDLPAPPGDPYWRAHRQALAFARVARRLSPLARRRVGLKDGNAHRLPKAWR